MLLFAYCGASRECKQRTKKSYFLKLPAMEVVTPQQPTRPIQSSQSYSNLHDADKKESKETLKYRKEIESYALQMQGVMESPKQQCASGAVSESIDVSVPSWSDKKGHTDYLISTALDAQPSGSIHNYHRFSEFITLHSRIQEPLGLVFEFPVPKTPFVTDGVKRYRMRALQGYLRHAVDQSISKRGPRCEDMPSALYEFVGADALQPLLAELIAAAAAEKAASAEAAAARASPELTALLSPPAPSAPAEEGRNESPDTIMSTPVPTPARKPSNNSEAEPVVMPVAMTALSKSGSVSAQSVFAVAALAVAAACMLLMRMR